MIGIFLLYFIWKRFADLASNYKKSRRANGWYGILSYLIGTCIGGLFLGIFDLIFALGINWDNNSGLNLVAIPFGLAGCYLLYYLLKKKWNLEIVDIESIDDIGKSITD